MTPEARTLLAAFKESDKKQQVEQVGVLVVEDGFDADSVRLLSAWLHTDLKWKPPSKKVPSGANPRAWAWLAAGMQVDYNRLADAAGVTRSIARQKLARLIAVRLVYPDGTIAAAGRIVIQAAIQERAKKSSKQPKDQKDAAPAKSPDAKTVN